ncbi:chemotaxis protein CheB [Kineococcus indalonis]|uniref:chemotaxis protein CheB n=1 Tax=Kineococcus indalonis TaxID=2696566 RepID=UPI0014133FDA|nr:chemotaxis protein CheB [Kineococcus indalonis]NAZ87102.1 chemotaxis protein CheB [Kineococcus indalonis]
MATRDVVVVGASAGGVEALRTLVAGLPADLPATVLVVLHVPPTGADALASILDRAGPLPARTAVPGEPLPRGTVLVATPDRHLMLAGGRVVHSTGPRENGHRPAVDVLFRSAAHALGARVVGVVLSGTLDDGTAGLVAVRSRGGVGVVQEPSDALFAAMPANAVAAADPEHVLPVAAIPALLEELVHQEVPDVAEARGGTGTTDPEVAVARFDMDVVDSDDHPGDPSGYTCPDCSGALWRIDDHGLLRFRCRVGHAWTAESLHEQQSAETEGALWVALRSLEERAALNRELSRRAEESGRRISAGRFGERADETTEAASVIRRLLTGRGDVTGDEVGA